MQKYLTVGKGDLNHIHTPEATATWQPIPHSMVVQTVDDYLEDLGVGVRRETYTVNPKGTHLFATYTLDISFDGAQVQLGFRNSNNKRFALGFVGGIMVIVCANMCFAGDEFIELRKHTIGLTPEVLMAFVKAAIDQVRIKAQAQFNWQQRLSNRSIQANGIKTFAYDCMVEGAFQPRQFNQFRECLDEEIHIADGVTLYQAHGAVTRLHRETPVHHMPEISKALTRVCNSF